MIKFSKTPNQGPRPSFTGGASQLDELDVKRKTTTSPLVNPMTDIAKTEQNILQTLKNSGNAAPIPPESEKVKMFLKFQRGN